MSKQYKVVDTGYNPTTISGEDLFVVKVNYYLWPLRMLQSASKVLVYSILWAALAMLSLVEEVLSYLIELIPTWRFSYQRSFLSYETILRRRKIIKSAVLLKEDNK